MELPKDPMILLSYVNTKLRDEYPSLDEFCAGLGVSKEELTDALEKVNFTYDADRNAFV